ncbi:hypothetical protein EZV62_018618 [Acer yangbiense]|uniref:Uncharacterized protein n=1 Tax=Acer yangbiense TaxID=1000413 RepID=A0A5C7HKM6_9ROSI|nr:hypothetical protein EZV62_018618 [Acer yangbiense]
MANTYNVNSSVPIDTSNANPTVGLTASAVGEVPVVLPIVASTTPAINSFVRNMPDPVMSQYMSQGNVPMANPYMNSTDPPSSTYFLPPGWGPYAYFKARKESNGARRYIRETHVANQLTTRPNSNNAYMYEDNPPSSTLDVMESGRR